MSHGNPGSDPSHPLTAGLHERLGRDQIIHRAIPFGDSPFNPSLGEEHPSSVWEKLGTALEHEPDPRYASERQIRAHQYEQSRRTDTGTVPVAGTHWTKDHSFATGWATRGAEGSQVVLHATDPGARAGAGYQRDTGVYVNPEHARHAEHEQEVTVEPGTRMHVHGVSFIGYRELPHPNPEAAAQGYTQREAVIKKTYPVDWTVQS